MTSLGTATAKKKIRTSTPRVKTGCGTCRRRRIKCDETRPQCRGCLRAGWKCDGYPSQSSVEVSRRPATVAKQAPLSISSYSIPFRCPGSQNDRQLLHYFCVQGASDISGFLSSSFWTQTVLQDSHHEPVVRQALVALSSLHLDYISSDSPDTLAITQGTLHQHGKALRMLQKRLESDDPEAVRVALVCCVLFYCFESTADNSHAAMHHLDRGLQVFSSNWTANGGDSSGKDKGIVDVFVRLDLQASFFDDERLPFLSLGSVKEPQAGVLESHGNAFYGLEDAQQALSKLQNSLFHFLISNVGCQDTPVELIPHDILEQKRQLQGEYERWLHQFTCFTTNATTETAEMLCGLQTLKIHHRITHMLLISVLPRDHDVFGASPNPAAEEVIGLAASILEHINERNAAAETAKDPRRNFSSETGIVAPLSLLAIKCADENVCRRATQLLAESKRREGLYDGATMAMIVRHLDDGKKHRLLQAEEGDRVNITPNSLEYCMADIIDGAPSGLVTNGRSIPKTVLRTPDNSGD